MPKWIAIPQLDGLGTTLYKILYSGLPNQCSWCRDWDHAVSNCLRLRTRTACQQYRLLFSHLNPSSTPAPTPNPIAQPRLDTPRPDTFTHMNPTSLPKADTRASDSIKPFNQSSNETTTLPMIQIVITVNSYRVSALEEGGITNNVMTDITKEEDTARVTPLQQKTDDQEQIPNLDTNLLTIPITQLEVQ